ncbi:MAG TPA: glycosyltransferase, partial [Acetobacteraceae bacterium]|nr:glycosyltransferase [Acetobacteraceae bacterium]
ELQTGFQHELRRIRTEEAAARDSAAWRYQNSMSWRITAPLRAAALVLRGRGFGVRPPGLPAAQPMLTPATGPMTTSGMDHRGAMRAVLANRLNAFLAGSGTLALPRASEVETSIVLVLHNQAELTFGCLSSIAECLGSQSGVEVVILDNASTDATDSLLGRVTGARSIFSRENLHFLRGVNLAVREARGRNILLLNNDAQVLPGTLEAAIRALRSGPNIGAVGGRLVLPDGTLQEAGSILWQDGTATGYGRGHAPSEPEFDFRRDVDFCSGAFLLTPREVFERLGGFDERYAPAYYEETDYCVRLHEAGLRVIYDPDVVVMHYEFGSSAGSAAALALQQRNHAVFLGRHAEWLAQRPARGRMLAGRSRPRGPRVLVLDDRVPHVRLGSGYPRTRDMLHELNAAGAEVTFFPMVPYRETRTQVRETLDIEIEVMLGHHNRMLRGFLEERRGHYDGIVVCRPHNMRDFRNAIGNDRTRIGGAVLIYDAEAIFAFREILQRRVAGNPVPERTAQKMVADEVALIGDVDAVAAVSKREAAVFEAQGVNSVRVLGYPIVPDPGTTPFAAREGFIFLGAVPGDESPNADSLRWFAAEVLPLLRREFGDGLRLRVVGQCDAPSIRALDGEALDLLGPIDDLRPIFEQARVMVAPTRFAAGIPLKMHQAAAFGVPVVSTTLIAELAGWRDGHDLLAASDASGFAEACARLHRDETLWTAIRNSALDRCATDCSPAAFRQSVGVILDMIAARSHAARTP